MPPCSPDAKEMAAEFETLAQEQLQEKEGLLQQLAAAEQARKDAQAGEARVSCCSCTPLRLRAATEPPLF